MRKFIRKLFLIFLLIFVIVMTTLLSQGYVRYEREIKNKPLDQAVDEYRNKENYVEFEDIDDDFVKAVISVEDKRYFDRKGYDIIALFRALYHDFLAKDIVEGGSTISEQIAKNLYLGGYVNGMEEKMAEIYLMLDLEKHYSKQELFALYANMNYYGDGYYGIYDASMGYYHNSPSDLSLAKAAMLAGIPNAPSIYQLSSGYELAKERQEWVLYTMLNNGYISENEYDNALKEDVKGY